MTVIVAAICLTLLLGAGALAVDLGVARTKRRDLISATDAAALAAARGYAQGEGDWYTTCAEVLNANAPDAVLGRCQASGSSGDGTIEVEATESFDYVLAPVFADAATDSGGAVASTTVHVGIPSVVRGLRPLALCVNDMDGDNDGGKLKDELKPLLGGAPSASVELDLRFGSSSGQVDDCRRQGNPDGPWTFIDLEPGPGDVDARVAEWAQHGNDGAFGDDASRDLPEFFPTVLRSGQSRGELQALDSALSGLAGEQALVALYDEAHPYQGDGAFAPYVRVVAFVRAEFISVELSGSSQDRITVRLFPWNVVEGSCCGVAGGLFDSPAFDLPETGEIQPPRLRTMRICSVDHAEGNCSG